MTLSLIRRTSRPSWLIPFGHGLFEPFFERFWNELHGITADEWIPSVDLVEKDGRYELTAELPGMRKDDINITLEDGYITISGKKEAEEEKKGADYYLKETRYGSFYRSFRLPGEVDEKKVEASYKDGVLRVTMPKKEGEKARKIKVH